LLTLFSDLHQERSLFTIIIGHVTLCLAPVFFSVGARLLRTPSRLAEAARDLGAGPFRAFWCVTLPSIRAAIGAGALLAAALSFGEAAVSVFLAGRDHTLPLEIWARARRGTISLELDAAATVMIGISVLLAIAFHLTAREG
ncbi:MAG: ABC transporter permease, partial [Chloroflexota bacterium]